VGRAAWPRFSAGLPRTGLPFLPRIATLIAQSWLHCRGCVAVSGAVVGMAVGLRTCYDLQSDNRWAVSGA
jgi:hypothetical protein